MIPFLARFLLPLGVLTVIILLVGRLPLRRRAREPALAVELGAHAAIWLVVGGCAVIWIPRTRKILHDFGAELSSLSVLVIQIAELMAQPLVMLIITAIVLAADGVIYSLLWENEAADTARNRFSLFMTLVPLSILLVFASAIYLPLLKVMQ
ncbi:MAG TPA: hypothetical protein VEI07_21200 [Planctomycetaceae bacterium]|nr:hypothetical protein [Planctomycetaceae bacterium]